MKRTLAVAPDNTSLNNKDTSGPEGTRIRGVNSSGSVDLHYVHL